MVRLTPSMSVAGAFATDEVCIFSHFPRISELILHLFHNLLTSLVVCECCTEVLESLRVKFSGVDANMGLFMATEADRPARWLSEERSLAFYDIKSNVSAFCSLAFPCPL